MMYDEEKSTVELLFDECKKVDPDLTKIDQFIDRCCNYKDDINERFYYKWHELTPLHMACENGHHEIVKKLLENGNNFRFPIDVNAISDRDDATPLHFACQKRCSLTVWTLLQHPNIDVNKGESSKRTPLHLACCSYSCKAVVVELLKHKNINLNYIDKNNATPLHLSCICNNNTAIVQLLLEHATIIDINATDDEGCTPLHNACSEYDLNGEKASIIKALLEHPSIRMYKNNNCDKPLDIVKLILDDTEFEYIKQQCHEIIQVFKDFHSRERWRMFCTVIKYEYTTD